MITEQRLKMDIKTINDKIKYLESEEKRLIIILDDEMTDPRWLLDIREQKILISNISRVRMEIEELKLKREIVKEQKKRESKD